MQVSPSAYVVGFYIYEKCKFEEAFLVLKPSKKFIGKSRICKMTERSGACASSDFDGHTILVGSDDNESCLEEYTKRGLDIDFFLELKLPISLQKTKL